MSHQGSSARRIAEGERQFLRHVVATLAYRAGKSLRDAPEDFGDLRVEPSTRTPREILTHVADLLEWVLSQARGEERWRADRPSGWEEEVKRFYRGLGALDDYLASSAPLEQSPSRLFQGGLADALTHVGQLNLLRRLAGSPVKGENYSRADIRAGQVGRAQPAPRREFE